MCTSLFLDTDGYVWMCDYLPPYNNINHPWHEEFGMHKCEWSGKEHAWFTWQALPDTPESKLLWDRRVEFKELWDAFMAGHTVTVTERG